MEVGTLPGPQEVTSITFEQTTANSTELHVKWETTHALGGAEGGEVSSG